LNYDNVNLWFAKDKYGNIITIDEINDSNRKNKYYCPLCNSDLIPKAIKSNHMSEHFAHIDASKCNAESRIHWWFKNKFIEIGDKFTIKTSKNIEFICKDIITEHTYNVDGKLYRPDLTILTECGQKICFEMKYSNKKKTEDYIDIWIGLKNIIVEIDIKDLIHNNVRIFNALFYDGKCFNVKKNDVYYNTIGLYKEEKYKYGCAIELKERFNKLDWFWRDVAKYKNNEVSIEYMVNLIDCIDENDNEILMTILNKKTCNTLYIDYIEHKLNNVFSLVCNEIKIKYGDEHLQYLRKEIVDDRYYKRKIGYVKILDVSDNCWNVENIFEHDTLHILNYFESAVKNNKEYLLNKEKEKQWEGRTNYLLNVIKSNLNTLQYLDIIKDRKYRLDTWFNYNYKNKYILNTSLHFEQSGVCAIRNEFEIINDSDIEYVTTCICKIIDEYFNSLVKFNLVEQINDIVEMISNEYNFIKELKIKSALWLEDIYEIDFCINRSEKRIYITNNGILIECRSDKYLFTYSSIDELKIYLLRILKEFIEKYYKSNYCIVCGKEFEIKLEEIKFYNQKNFNLPKRCSECRTKRRLTNK